MSEHVEKWRLQAAEWLDAQQAADILRETKADFFAEIQSKMNGSSEAERTRLARVSNEWKEYRSAMIDAEAKARRLKMRMKYQEMMFDAWRTNAANSRQEKARY
jgi:hypothetical protein